MPAKPNKTPVVMPPADLANPFMPWVDAGAGMTTAWLELQRGFWQPWFDLQTQLWQQWFERSGMPMPGVWMVRGTEQLA